MLRRRALPHAFHALCALMLLCTAAGPAVAQEAPFPSRPVTLVTPFAAGSGPDAVLRLVADKLQRQWNQRVVVDNRPGGGGFIAIDAVRRAPADGYTLLELDSEHLSALPHLYKSRNFRTLETFEPVAPLFRTPFMVAVSSSSPLRSMTDLITAAKAANGGMTYGSWGVGSPGHLGGAHLESLAGVTMQHVPYREVSQLYTSVATGDVGWAFGTLPSSQGPYKAGKLRYLAIAAPKRIPQLPDVPTVAEAGGPAALDVNSFVVLVSPRGLPAEVRARLHADVAKAVREPDIAARFDAFAFEALNWSPEEINRQAEIKNRTYEQLVRTAHISLE